MLADATTDNAVMTDLPFSPAAERNKQPILDALSGLLPAQGHMLEIASGTGQHAAFFAAGLPGWRWQPTDVERSALSAIRAWAQEARVTNVNEPVQLDVLAGHWPVEEAAFDAMYCANMLHIAPWSTCAALMRGAAKHLAPNGKLITYGPYLEDTVPISAGNRTFDASLRAENPAWGIRRREDVADEAQRVGLVLLERHAMPANNLLLVWGREP